MPKFSTLGQTLWPTGREQTDTHTDRQTEKANTEAIQEGQDQIRSLISS